MIVAQAPQGFIKFMVEICFALRYPAKINQTFFVPALEIVGFLFLMFSVIG